MAKPATPVAPTNGTTAATAPVAPPTFIARPMSDLPKRLPPASEPDLTVANALLEIVSGTTVIDGETVGMTASDGKIYADPKLARQAANRAKRALGRVAPAGKIAKSRVWGDDNAKEWAVFLADAPVEAAAPAAATS